MARSETSLGLAEAAIILGLSFEKVEDVVRSGDIRVVAWRGSEPRLSAEDVRRYVTGEISENGKASGAANADIPRGSWAERREALGLSVEELARLADVSRLELFKAESGRREPSRRLSSVVPATLEELEREEPETSGEEYGLVDGYSPNGHLENGSVSGNGGGISHTFHSSESRNGYSGGGSSRIRRGERLGERRGDSRGDSPRSGSGTSLQWSEYAGSPDVEVARRCRRGLSGFCPAEILLARYAAEGGLEDERLAAVIASVLAARSPFEVADGGTYSCSEEYAAALAAHLRGRGEPAGNFSLIYRRGAESREGRPVARGRAKLSPAIPAEEKKALAVLSALGLHPSTDIPEGSARGESPPPARRGIR